MDEPSAAQSKAMKQLPASWAFAIVVVLVIVVLLVAVRDTTVLTPIHENVIEACLVVAALSGLFCIGLVFLKTRGIVLWRRVGISLSAGIGGAIAAFILTASAADAVEGLIDFPRGSTSSLHGVIPISRAYRFHNKGESWTIWTEPYNAQLNIARQDYDFMLAHRRPGDEGRDPDRISSMGYFCVSVTMEQSGDALRIIHAGSHQLPAGSVIVCPSPGG